MTIDQLKEVEAQVVQQDTLFKRRFNEAQRALAEARDNVVRAEGALQLIRQTIALAQATEENAKLQTEPKPEAASEA